MCIELFKWEPVTPGDLATWASAFATVIAVVVALFGPAHQRKIERRRAERDLRSLAKLILFQPMVELSRLFAQQSLSNEQCNTILDNTVQRARIAIRQLGRIQVSGLDARSADLVISAEHQLNEFTMVVVRSRQPDLTGRFSLPIDGSSQIETARLLLAFLRDASEKLG